MIVSDNNEFSCFQPVEDIMLPHTWHSTLLPLCVGSFGSAPHSEQNMTRQSPFPTTVAIVDKTARSFLYSNSTVVVLGGLKVQVPLLQALLRSDLLTTIQVQQVVRVRTSVSLPSPT